MNPDFEKIIIVTGHYGSGKTNLSINLALDIKRRGEAVTLADLDIVNPYFRSADFGALAAENGIELITPAYANSSIDIPSLTAALDAKLSANGTLIIDVGGDDAGAFALGRYSPRILERPYTMLCVINRFRYMTRKPEEAVILLGEIEAASRIKVTHLANNSNLSVETTVVDIEAGIEYAKQTARLSGIPLAFSCVRADIYETLPDNIKGECRPVDIYVKTPWQ